MSESIKKSILRIISKDENTSSFCIPEGSGFFINKNGYFITARHCINTKDIDKYRVKYNNSEYKFQRVNKIEYSKNIDILIYKITPLIDEIDYYINIEYIDIEQLDGDIKIFGIPNKEGSENSIKMKKLDLKGISNDRIELVNNNIEKGCSGGPAFLTKENKEQVLIGIVTHTLKDIHYIIPINSIMKIFDGDINELLGYNFKNQSSNNIVNKRSGISKECKTMSNETKKRLLNQKNIYFIFDKLHNKVEHNLIKIEQELYRQYELYNNKHIKQDVYERYLRTSIKGLLENFKEVFDVICGDISIHLKLIEEKTDDNKKIYFQTIVRQASIREEKTDYIRTIRGELFEVSNKFDFNELEKVQKKLNNIKDNITRVNYAYNQVVFGYSKYWVCNNLRASVKNKEYFSGSKDYPSYYNSLAIFVVCEKEDDEYNIDIENNSISNIKGLLIIDSIDSGCFEKKLIKEVGGYIAHKLDRFLSRKYFNILF